MRVAMFEYRVTTQFENPDSVGERYSKSVFVYLLAKKLLDEAEVQDPGPPRWIDRQEWIPDNWSRYE